MSSASIFQFKLSERADPAAVKVLQFTINFHPPYNIFLIACTVVTETSLVFRRARSALAMPKTQQRFFYKRKESRVCLGYFAPAVALRVTFSVFPIISVNENNFNLAILVLPTPSAGTCIR